MLIYKLRDAVSVPSAHRVEAASASSSHSHGSWVLSGVIGLIVMAVALVQIVNPRLMWRAKAWSLRNPAASEPSNAGYTAARFAGAFIFCVGALFLYKAVSAF